MSRNSKFAFSLAEVLITCAIIGVVCMLTVPQFIDNYQKKLAPLYVEKFYSEMQQILMLAKMKNAHCEITDDMQYNADGFINWYNRCLAKYMRNALVDTTKDDTDGLVVFPNGSAFYGYAREGRLHFFFCTKEKYCGAERYDGRTSFLFTYIPNNRNGGKLYTSLPEHQNLSRAQLLNACKYGNTDNAAVSSKNRRHACARLIEVDGWKLADDYPWKQVDIRTGNKM